MKNDAAMLRLDVEYKNFLLGIKERLRAAQIRASFAANTELIKFYWQLGTDIIEKQAALKWGDGFLKQLSDDMRQNFPGLQGFSVRNLQRIKQFAQQYPDFLIAPQAVAQLPWGHLAYLISSVKDFLQRDWYAKQAIKNGWSRSILEMQIETNLYARQGIAQTKTSNFDQCLPPAQSDLANEILKDPYNFEFLNLHEKSQERDIENALITHVRDFLLELGQGFAFVGSQVPLTFDDDEFFMDLLFYHLNLRCFVVIELKTTKFKPSHTGQLGFYMTVVDDLYRKEGDNQTIGILLCKSKNKVIAEYALRNLKSPMGISEYALSKSLPNELQSNLPSIEQLEAELNEVTSDALNADADSR